MPNYDAVINVTNYFKATTKIKSMELGDVRSGAAFKKLCYSPELLNQTLKTIADASPSSKQRSDIDIHNRIDKGTNILNTYHELSSKLNKSRSSEVNIRDIIDVARIVKPVMQGNTRANIDKILQIYEILIK